MQNPEELAQEALKFLELAQKFEDEQKLEKAISNYQKAAEFLKKSGYLMHRVEDIFERVENLNNFLKKEKFLQYTQEQVQFEHLQTQAFALLEGAKKLEFDGFFDDAINQYQAAVKLLTQSGWSESQLENLKSKINNLADNVKRISSQSSIESSAEMKPQVVGFFGKKTSAEKAVVLDEFMKKKKREEEIQNQAFLLIEKAKKFETDRKFKNAITNYENAIEALSSIGWNTHDLNLIVEKIKRDEQQFINFQRQRQLSIEQMPDELKERKVSTNLDAEKFKDKIVKFEERKTKEEQVQVQAFKLMDIGKRLEREKNYDQAIEKFEESIELLKSIEWDSYIQPIINLIEDIKEKQKREKEVEHLKIKREKDLSILQKSIYLKQREQIMQSSKEFELKRKEHKQKRELAARKEQDLFIILEKADKILKNKDFDGAISEYEKALTILEDLGPSWQNYSELINSTISHVQNFKISTLNKQYEEQKRLEEREKTELEFQKHITDLLNKERNQLKKKEIELKDHEEDIRYLEQRKNEAFKILDDALDFLNQGEYDKAIHMYQNAGNNFAEIQWIDELPMIENAIREVEELQLKQSISNQKKMEEAIEKQKAEEEFQQQIAQYLRQERDKLKKREIIFREREKELQYREERRKEGFQLLAKGQEYVKQGKFDEAIELLQNAKNLFADIDWHSEINLIQNSIIEIENKKRERELQKQIELQANLEREKQERKFQEFIAKEVKQRQDKLKERKLLIREKEKERIYREEQKEEAFNLLERAHEYLSSSKFDEALELYYSVANIFAKIQWKEEIPIIQEAINEIENKKRENGILKQKLLQKEIEKESKEKAFIEKIRYQQEREKEETLKRQEFIEKQKHISAQNLARQENAFKLIDDANIFIQNEKFMDSIEKYKKAITLLKEVGWEGGYLISLQETIDSVKIKIKEKEEEKQREYQQSLKHQKEEEEFQKKIAEYLRKEENRIKERQIEVQKAEDLMKEVENRKLEAFQIMDDALNSLNQGNYEVSIEKYRQAELILNEINFPSEAIREMIQKIKEKTKEEELNRLKELELKIKKEQEEVLFQQQTSEKMKYEELKMIEKEEELRKEDEIHLFEEKKKNEAFNLLDKAQTLIEQNDFDTAISLYNDAAEVFAEIQWNDEINLIKDSIIVIQNKKRERELQKQNEIKEALEQERLEKEFQELIISEMKAQREKLKQQEITIKEEEKQLAYFEKEKEKAFDLLSNAQKLITEGNFDKSIEIYNEVANIFAQIQWTEEIPIIQEAIRDLEEKKREQLIRQQKELEKTIEKEKENFAFMEQLRVLTEQEKFKALETKIITEKQELISAQNLEKQKDAFKLIDEGHNLLIDEKFDDALKNYQEAIKILANIGWQSEDLKLLYGNIRTIEKRKEEKERVKEKEEELLIKQKKEEEEFTLRIATYMEREKERFREKEIRLQKQEEQLKYLERRKIEAFDLMDSAENFLNQGKNDLSIDNYRKAELILNEIGFPTKGVREMIQKVEEKNREALLAKQKELERRLKQEREEKKFQQEIAESSKINEIKMKAKQQELESQKKLQEYVEKRRTEAFDILEEGEVYINQSQYDKAIECYRTAELILNEITFPTDVIREMIQKVQEKKRIEQLQRQKEIELKIEKEKEEWDFQRKVTEQFNREKERLKLKQIEIKRIEKLKDQYERRKKDAFKFLDKAEISLKNLDYDSAIENYRKADLILNELRYPTSSIKNSIIKIKELKKQKEDSGILKAKKDLERLEEERKLKVLIDERQRQEKEKKKAQQLAIQERDRIIQEQMSIRESAYSLLDEAGKYLKQFTPDYNKAISYYIQARNLLAENIGWEPEINNLDRLIKDLQNEQIQYREKKRLEEQARIKRQKEYELFQEEVKRIRLEQEKLKREQEKKYRELVLERHEIERLRDEGLRLIDEGKKWAAYHNFEKAYNDLEIAISKFREIGWIEEIKYIETEIKNTKLLEEKVNKEELRIQKIQEQLQKQRDFEKQQRIEEENKLRGTISEVGTIADEVMEMIKRRQEAKKLADKEKAEETKVKAKEFRKKMGNLIKIKQELIKELELKEKEEKRKQEELQQAKDREQIDDLKRMIKEAEKKKKK